MWGSQAEEGISQEGRRVKRTNGRFMWARSLYQQPSVFAASIEMELGPGEVHSFTRAQRSQRLAFNLLVCAEQRDWSPGRHTGSHTLISCSSAQLERLMEVIQCVCVCVDSSRMKTSCQLNQFQLQNLQLCVREQRFCGTDELTLPRTLSVPPPPPPQEREHK